MIEYLVLALSFGLVALITVHTPAFRMYKQYIVDERLPIGVNGFVGALTFFIIATVLAPFMFINVVFQNDKAIRTYTKALISTAKI